jgi:hypothetical protein
MTIMSPFLDEHKKFLLLLIKHKVDFIVIGGYAVIYHGYERTTGDMDLWLSPDNDNRDKFINALKEHGVIKEHLEKINILDFTQPQVLHIGEKPNQIDFLTFARGLDFDEAYQKKEILILEGKPIPVLNFEHLIVTKMLLGRPQDKADIDKLKKIQQYRNIK